MGSLAKKRLVTKETIENLKEYAMMQTDHIIIQGHSLTSYLQSTI